MTILVYGGPHDWFTEKKVKLRREKRHRVNQAMYNKHVFQYSNRQYHDEINKKKIIYEKEKLDDQ